MHQWDEIVKEKDRTQAMCNKSIQKLQQDATRPNKVANSIIAMQPYLSKHRLKEYDNLFMQNTISRIKQKSLQLQAFNVDTQWNLVQVMFQTYLQTLFDEHKVDEANPKRRLKTYREANPEFKYESTYVTLEDNFNTSIFQILISMKQVQVERLKKFNQAHLQI